MTAGAFLETFPQRVVPAAQLGRAYSRTSAILRPDVLRGLHYHFHQVDYWFCVNGNEFRLRWPICGRTARTFRQTETLEIGENATKRASSSR